MLIVGMNPAHDGSVAVVQDRELLYCLESEKDSFPRHEAITPTTTLNVLARLDDVPDVVAIGGWNKRGTFPFLGDYRIETGYMGAQETSRRETKLCGRHAQWFSSTHERSHIMMGAGMAPPDDAPLRAVLVWEGRAGAFYLLDEHWAVTREIPVLSFPGGRYELVLVIADPSYGEGEFAPLGVEPGNLMALAAYGDPNSTDPAVTETVDYLVNPNSYAEKGTFKHLPLYNHGVETDLTKDVAAVLTRRLFEWYAHAAQEHIPPGIPLYISGGCGLNCDWNMMWRELDHFSSIFVPPCTNDSGSSVGTALDALHAYTGDPRASWNVYCGLEFEWDRDPDPAQWERQELDEAQLADAIASGHIVAWVQGRWEMGPRALGNRSLLAEPFNAATHDRLNEIKQREGYRPIAPCCRLEDAGKVFSTDFHDPFMLYFRMVTSPDLEAVTHVDGSARVQTVTRDENEPLHRLLTAFGERHGVGVLCNTSLNYKKMGFINRMSDLTHYCHALGIEDIVVGGTWFKGIDVRDPSAVRTARGRFARPAPAGSV